MTTHRDTEDLLDKIRDLPEEEVAEVIDFVDFLRSKHAPGGSTREGLVRNAARAGILVPPAPNAQRSSVSDLPPVVVPGKRGSEMVIEDRR